MKTLLSYIGAFVVIVFVLDMWNIGKFTVNDNTVSAYSEKMKKVDINQIMADVKKHFE